MLWPPSKSPSSKLLEQLMRPTRSLYESPNPHPSTAAGTRLAPVVPKHLLCRVASHLQKPARENPSVQRAAHARAWARLAQQSLVRRKQPDLALQTKERADAKGAPRKFPISSKIHVDSRPNPELASVRLQSSNPQASTNARARTPRSRTQAGSPEASHLQPRRCAAAPRVLW